MRVYCRNSDFYFTLSDWSITLEAIDFQYINERYSWVRSTKTVDDVISIIFQFCNKITFFHTGS